MIDKECRTDVPSAITAPITSLATNYIYPYTTMTSKAIATEDLASFCHKNSQNTPGGQTLGEKWCKEYSILMWSVQLQLLCETQPNQAYNFLSHSNQVIVKPSQKISEKTARFPPNPIWSATEEAPEPWAEEKPDQPYKATSIVLVLLILIK